MRRQITGFHLDEEQHWVAQLDCGHNQHVRHKPPFINRPWTQSEAGRNSMLGEQLNCVRCDRLELPENLLCVETSPVFNSEDLSCVDVMADKRDCWVRLTVTEGELLIQSNNPNIKTQEVTTIQQGIICPGMQFVISTKNSSVLFFLDYYRVHRF